MNKCRDFPNGLTFPPSLSPFLRSKWPSYFLCKPRWNEREDGKDKMCWLLTFQLFQNPQGFSRYIYIYQCLQWDPTWSDPERQTLLKSFDSVFTDWQMFWWSDKVKSSSRVVFWTGGHLVLNRCRHVFWYSYIYICNLKNMYIYITYW